ncbi:MAG: helix-turn-helix transcriptional regulator [Mucilaginibacter polytrichastri]|nr:helix-turn-helix transcriptional regulator [Mucilaginibacter polytrichastri]
MSTLYIKNMVCNRCILVVGQELEKLGFSPVKITLGEVELREEISEEQRAKIGGEIGRFGFELLDDQRKQTIEKVKNSLISEIQSGEIAEHFSLATFFNTIFHKDYSAVSKLFSEVEGCTIEQFYIQQKIEKVKEWLTYDELTLSEIAWKLGYSSVAHLSAQFKRVTGMTPTAFKQAHKPHRIPIDEL